MPSLTRRHFTTGLLAAPFMYRRQVATPESARPLRLAGSPSGIVSLDPTMARDLDTIFVMRQLHRGLLKLDLDVQPVPELADIETTDNRTFRFLLRPTARFADGTPITSAAVHGSLVSAISPATMIYLEDVEGATDVLKGASTSLAGFVAIDDQAFEIRLSQPSQTFPVRIAAVQVAIVDVDNLANTSGPYVLVTLTEDMLELQPNPWYASPPIHPVSIRIGSSASNAPNLLQSGEIDMAVVDGATASLLTDPASGLEVKVERTPQLATYYVALSNTMAPWNDLSARQTLQRSFDTALVTGRLFGDTVDPAFGLVPPSLLASPAIPTDDGGSPPFDLPALPVYATDITPIEHMAVASGTAGLAIQPVQVNWTDFLDGLAQRRFPAYGIYWGADYPSPEAFLRMLFLSQSTDNYVDVVDTTFDALVEAGDFAAAQQRLIDLALVIPVYHDVQYTAIRRGILAAPLSSMGFLGLESVVLTR